MIWMSFEFVRTIAIARILMPKSMVRLSAGREMMNEQMQALCFLAGANSIFYGERLLTTANPAASKDQQLFDKLGLEPMPHQDYSDEVYQAVITDELNEQHQPRYYQVN